MQSFAKNSRRWCGLLALATCLTITGGTIDQVITVPTTPETSGVNTAIRNAARTYLSYYNASQLTSLTDPTMITGMQIRISQAGNAAIAATLAKPSVVVCQFRCAIEPGEHRLWTRTVKSSVQQLLLLPTRAPMLRMSGPVR